MSLKHSFDRLQIKQTYTSCQSHNKMVAAIMPAVKRACNLCEAEKIVWICVKLQRAKCSRNSTTETMKSYML